jgi:delta 1-pyrroline-5-carboxylate dehydrogenase
MNKPAELALDTVPVWINGRPVSAAQRFGEVFNPATGQVTKRVVFADGSIVDAAVKAATAALPAWRDTPPLRRARHRLRHAPPRRPALVRRMVHIAAFAADHLVDQRIHIHHCLHRFSICSIYNQIGTM